MTDKTESNWYTDKQIEWLENLMNERHDAMKELIHTRFDSVKEAVNKLEEINKEFRKNSNEWRGALDDTIDKTATKEMFSQLLSRVEKQDIINQTSHGRFQLLQYVPWAISVLFLILAVISYFKK